MVKGSHVLHTGQEAPKSHNIIYIFERIFNDGNCPANAEKEAHIKLFTRLYSFYISERYADYKQKVGESLDREVSRSLLQETEAAFQWLQSLKK